MSKIVCVVPSIRPEMMEKFKKAWAPLFEKHHVTLITVWDGDDPKIEFPNCPDMGGYLSQCNPAIRDLFYRRTDSCRNFGFLFAAEALQPDYILTLDDDVAPLVGMGDGQVYYDPIQQHLDALNKQVPISWMNTAQGDLYLRGVPYGIRDEAPVMLSHGVWIGTPDFDGETQLRLENGWTKKYEEGGLPAVPYTLDYYKGPIPRGILFPLCGMNVMIRKEALPYFYFAPMGPDTGITGTCPECVDRNKMTFFVDPGPCPRCGSKHGSEGKISTLHRFGDIWMGINLKRNFDNLGWACYTGASTVHHTRASDAKKNMEQEKLGRQWNEVGRHDCVDSGDPIVAYFQDYRQKRERYERLIKSIMEKS